MRSLYFLQKSFVAMILLIGLVFLAGCQNSTESNQTPGQSGVEPTSTGQSRTGSSPTGQSTVEQTPTGQSSMEPTSTPEPTETQNIEPSSIPTKSSTPTQPIVSESALPATQVTAVRLADPQSGWVGGEGWIGRTDDGGKTWQVQYKGKETVKQLFALNDREAWAVMANGSANSDEFGLLGTTDGGEHWRPVGQVPNAGFLHFVTSQEAFSGNAHSIDGGKTWTLLSVPEHMVGDAYFRDKNHGWAVTQADDQLVVKRTLDGGKTWSDVMSRQTAVALSGAIVRSAGADDAWILCLGDSGMSQRSYSLFHTSDGGKQWETVIANSTAGAGPAPGFPMEYDEGPHNQGSSPGTLYVVSPKVAFMGGQCMACDKPNTMGRTIDGGKTWENRDGAFEGYGEQLVAMADADHGWWITTDAAAPAVMYTTSDGGKHWKKVHVFER